MRGSRGRVASRLAARDHRRLFYSVGAVLNLLHWPPLWPEFFGTHELFHLFVIAGSLAHYWFILTIVVPFRLGSGPGRLASTRFRGL